MEMVFFDYLQLRGKLMVQFQDVPAGEEGEHLWLAGATNATLELGAEMQFCMAWAHHVLGSVEWPAVTNARASGDGGGRVAAAGQEAGLLWLHSRHRLEPAERAPDRVGRELKPTLRAPPPTAGP